jgi:hypothetical protein
MCLLEWFVGKLSSQSIAVRLERNKSQDNVIEGSWRKQVMAQHFSWEINLANQALLPNVVKMFWIYKLYKCELNYIFFICGGI